MNATPHIFVISLAGSARRAAMERKLSRWRGQWSFVDAVDGQRLSPTELATSYDETAAIRAYGYPLTPGEIGCALSHRSVYESMVRQGTATAIVLEDDAEFSDTFLDFPFWSVKCEFDVVSFYTSLGYIRRRPRENIAGIGLHRAVGKVRNTVGYMVSYSGAAKLLAAARIIRNVADWPIYPLDLSFYVATPYLVNHPRTGSCIDHERREVRRTWTSRDGCFAWLTGGPAAHVADALFIKFFVRRASYKGPYDYYRREIAEPIKRMLPFAFRVLLDSGGAAHGSLPPHASLDGTAVADEQLG